MDVQIRRSWERETLLYIPPAFALLSIVYVSSKVLRKVLFNNKGDRKEASDEEDSDSTSGGSLYGAVQKLDGFLILLFRLLRLLTVIALLSLEVYGSIAGLQASAQAFQIPFFVYTFLLAVTSMVASPRLRDTTSLQLALLLFVDFLVYSVLDVCPYAMIDPTPYDPPTESATWLRVILLAFGGGIIPLVMPRPFRPSAANTEPSASETACLFSRYTFSYLDGIIFYANRVPDITVKDMPQIPEQGRIEALAERVLAALDPAQVGKRHFLWGVLRVWAKDYALLNLIWGTNAVVQFAGPFGTRKLLEYLEAGVSPSNFRPWAWILVLVVGPLISACLFTHFLYVGSRVIVENTSAFTYLVFHHALRIRLRSNALDSDAKKSKGDEKIKSADGSSQTAATPSSADEPGSEEATGSNTGSKSAETIGKDAESAPTGGHAKEKTGHLLGKINTLITTDIESISRTPFIVALPGTTLQVIIAIIFLYDLLGWSSFVGLAVMAMCAPVPVYAGQSMAKVQKSKMAATDKRVQYVTEAMGIIRMIKLFGWEPYMLTQLARRRDEELVKIRKVRVLEATMNVASAMLPIFSKVVVIAIYTMVSRGELKASVIFSALMVFSMMEEQIGQIMFVIPEILRAKVSFDRFSEFLNSTELLTEGNALRSLSEDDSARDTLILEQPGRDVIGFKQCSFSWNPFGEDGPSSSATHQTRKQFILRFDDEVVFKRGQINIIVGPTAAGKTSVLMALLGEMYCKPHGVGAWYNLPRDGGIAYVPQESWVLNETIKENILFGEPYDEERYKKVLSQCALEKDLELWKAGDLTEVGEKGLTLSGGQKARVSLARALYSSASVLLLDDVLAALDVHTAKWIVDKALQGDLVTGRTILLVTHNIALAAPIAEYVVVLNRHGNVSAQGPVFDILKRDSRLRAQVEKESQEIEENIEKEDNDADKDKDNESNVAKKATGKLVIAEEKAMGRVELAAIMLYLTSIGGPLIWTLILGSKLLESLIQIFATWFMGYWSNQYGLHAPTDVPVLKYLLLFALLNLSGFLTDLASQILWIFRSVRASKIIHSQLIQSIFTSTFRWLDLTPVGRIITRCTQDMSTIDVQLGHMMSPFISLSINLACLFVSSVTMAGWYAFVSGLFVTISGGLLGLVYLKCQMCVRRELSNAKAPVMSQVGTALASLPSIRAYGAQKMFDTELRKRIDVLARTSYCTYDISRWVSIRMDSLGAVFAGVVAACLTYSGRVKAGYAGFTLSIVLAFSRQILYWVRIYYMLEVQANSLERMLDFMRIEHEPQPSESGKPPAYWPSSGDLRVEGISARYSDESPTVLRNISFAVKRGERVGIVGRTCAGKSSIALALLRAIITDGKVFYDGIATDEINLDALRSNITLIPQQPELIHGTLRENLDPFGQHDDATLNDALNAAGLFAIKDLATSQQQPDSDHTAGSSTAQSKATPEQVIKIGLDTMVESGGTNFSLGQRQIIALARAIVRRSKLLILDEATAAIDYDTDTAIQRTLRLEFSEDTTLLTIAHRLRTIIDYDKILVLNEGELVEFDSPKVLLKKADGYFRALVEESDDWELLHNLAGAL